VQDIYFVKVEYTYNSNTDVQTVTIPYQ